MGVLFYLASNRYPVDPATLLDFFVAELVRFEPFNGLAQSLFRDRFGQEFPSPRSHRLNDHHGIVGFGERQQPGVAPGIVTRSRHR